MRCFGVMYFKEHAGRPSLKNSMYSSISSVTFSFDVGWKLTNISTLIQPFMDSMVALSVGALNEASNEWRHKRV